MSVRIGIDLGGTKIEAIALDEDGRETFRQRIASPRGDYDGTIVAIRQLVLSADAAVGAIELSGDDPALTERLRRFLR